MCSISICEWRVDQPNHPIQAWDSSAYRKYKNPGQTLSGRVQSSRGCETMGSKSCPFCCPPCLAWCHLRGRKCRMTLQCGICACTCVRAHVCVCKNTKCSLSWFITALVFRLLKGLKTFSSIKSKASFERHQVPIQWSKTEVFALERMRRVSGNEINRVSGWNGRSSCGNSSSLLPSMSCLHRKAFPSHTLWRFNPSSPCLEQFLCPSAALLSLLIT